MGLPSKEAVKLTYDFVISYLISFLSGSTQTADIEKKISHTSFCVPSKTGINSKHPFSIPPQRDKPHQGHVVISIPSLPVSAFKPEIERARKKQRPFELRRGLEKQVTWGTWCYSVSFLFVALTAVRWWSCREIRAFFGEDDAFLIVMVGESRME